MRNGGAKTRLLRALREEGGFSLPEVVVVVAILGMVLLALYGIFNMSIRVFSFGNDKVESTENARVALERMEREIRAAYPYDQGAATPDRRVLDASSGGVSGARTDGDQITFFNELGNDGKANGANETISFYVSGGNLIRRQGAAAKTITALGPGGALAFEYFHRTSADTPVTPSTSEGDVGRVRITLRVAEDGAWQDPGQDLVTDVDLRNRSS